MGNGGYIKLWRKIRESWIWEDPDYYRAWSWLLMEASYAERSRLVNGNLRHLEAGEAFISNRYMADALGWSTKKVRKFLHLLAEDDMVDLERTREGTHLKVRQWSLYQSNNDDYQNAGPTDFSERTHRGPTEDPPRTHRGPAYKDKKGKKGKKGKKVEEGTGKALSGRALRASARRLVDFLNEKAGRRFEHVDSNLDLIVARLKELCRNGRDLETAEAECRMVVAMKVGHWEGDAEMEEYLRPKTLFNRSKFWSYHGLLGTKAARKGGRS